MYKTTIKFLNGFLEGKLLEIENKKSFIIGRGEYCEVRIPYVTDSNISREHCEVLILEDKILVKDLNSSNGIFVNEAQIITEKTLEKNDILKIGETNLKFELIKKQVCYSCGRNLSNDELFYDKLGNIVCISCRSSSKTICYKI